MGIRPALASASEMPEFIKHAIRHFIKSIKCLLSHFGSQRSMRNWTKSPLESVGVPSLRFWRMA